MYAKETSDYFIEKQQGLVRGQCWEFCQKIWCSQRLKLKRENSEMEPSLLLSFAVPSDFSHWPCQTQLEIAENDVNENKQARTTLNFIH